MDRSKFDEMMRASLPLESMETMQKEFEKHTQEGMANNVVSMVEATKISLAPGDVLFLTIKNDDLDALSLNSLKKQLQPMFPNNKVVVLGLGTKDKVNFAIASQDTVVDSYLAQVYKEEFDESKE